MLTKIATVAAAALVGLSSHTVAFAQDDGLSGLHDKRREGGRLCMADHFHDGTGSGHTRKLAETLAARAWAEFTSWEYSPRWGSWSTAASKSMNCSNGGGSWSCQASARPCRRG